MPLILGTNSIKDTGYDVDNSLRFSTGSSDYLKRSQLGGNREKWTFSTWIKKTLKVANNIIINPIGVNIAFNTSHTIYMDVSGVGRIFETNAVYRDVSAWYNIVVAFNTTDYSTVSAGQVKVYVNGVEPTFSSTTNMSQGFDSGMNQSGVDMAIGRDESGDNNYADQYLAEVVLIDGQQLDATSFGEFDEDSGIWKPIDVSGLTFGTNGFYLPFENSAALGQDDSGNGNNFTVNNLTSIDQTTDTPTNNFPTGNPLVPTTLTYSDGNNTISHGADWKASPATIAVTQGKWYAEMKLVSTSFGATFGVEDMDLVSTWSAVLVGTSVNGRGYYSSDGTVYNNGSPSAFGATYTTGDIVGIALDMDNKFVYFSKNGVYQNSGVPTSGASGTGGLSLAGTTYAFAYGMYNSTSSLNFGNPPFTISSGNSDANGYGNFEYAVPSGYYALNTKNLAEYG